MEESRTVLLIRCFSAALLNQFVDEISAFRIRFPNLFLGSANDSHHLFRASAWSWLLAFCSLQCGTQHKAIDGAAFASGCTGDDGTLFGSGSASELLAGLS